jgi:flagellar biosynthetic protein FliQ
MSPEIAADLFRSALTLALKLSAPVLLAMTATAVLFGVLQAATQIQDAAVSFTPKIAAGFVATVLLAPWMLRILIEFMVKTLSAIPMVLNR